MHELSLKSLNRYLLAKLLDVSSSNNAYSGTGKIAVKFGLKTLNSHNDIIANRTAKHLFTCLKLTSESFGVSISTNAKIINKTTASRAPTMREGGHFTSMEH